MKRMLALVLWASLILCACTPVAEETVPDTQSAHTETTDIVTTDAYLPAAQKPMVTVSVPAVTQEYTDENGTVIFRHTYQSMSLIMQDPEVADKVIIDFLNRVDQNTNMAATIQAQAEAAYPDAAGWTPYLCSLTYSPTRIDQTLLSLYGCNILYTGGAHPDYSCCAANYDMITGEVLTLGSILSYADSLEPLCDMVIEKLKAVADEKYLREGFESTVRQRFAGNEAYDEDWFFSTNGLCFYFAPYEIAPYSSGVVIAEIPYSELTGIIADEFFPPELDTAAGRIQSQNIENAELEQFTRISELILDVDQPALVLFPDDTVYNICITAYDTQLNNSYTVYAAHSLSFGDAIMIEAADSTLSTLTLSYESNGETITVPLSAE